MEASDQVSLPVQLSSLPAPLPEAALEEVQAVAEALVSVIKLASEAFTKQQAAKKAEAKKQSAALAAVTAATASNPDVDPSLKAAASVQTAAQKPDVAPVPPPAASTAAADVEPELTEDAILADLARAASACPAAALPTLAARTNLSRLLRASVGFKRQLDDMAELAAVMARPLEPPPAGSVDPVYRCPALSTKHCNLPKW